MNKHRANNKNADYNLVVDNWVLSASQTRFGGHNFYYDSTWFVTLVWILCIGFIMLSSASMAIANHYYHNQFYFIIRQAVFLLITISSCVMVLHVPVKEWQQWSGHLILLSFILLILVLVPGIGATINGSSRWINLRVISLQVSELVKIAVVLYVASYLVRHRFRLGDFGGFIRPLCILGLLAALLLLEPDFGSTVVIGATMFSMMFLGGARILQFVVVLCTIVLAFVLIAVVSPYRLARITSFLNPWEQAFGSGYQLTQALIAFGRGGWFGTGLGHSIQKLFYLPEAHTDFLFAVFAEEFGVVGQLGLLFCFGLVFYRGMRTAYMAAILNEWYICYVVSGLSINLGIQVLINIGVNVGLLPTKGLALPFVSYGGSNLLFNAIGMAIVARGYNDLCVLQLANNQAVVNRRYPDLVFDNDGNIRVG